MSQASRSTAPGSFSEPRSSFIKDAQARLARHYADQARLATLETALRDCVDYIATTYGPGDNLPEPACSIAAKQLLGWRLG
jgi:hypothetical protein